MDAVFSWKGDPINIGKEKHYDSFVFYDVLYSIGDCVYMNSKSSEIYLQGDIYHSWIGEIESAWEINGKAYFECRWYYGNLDIPEIKRPEYQYREIYETNHINDNLITSIIKKVNVVSYEEFLSKQNDYEELKRKNIIINDEDYYLELFWCNKFYDLSLKTFRVLPKETYDIKSKRVFLYSHHRSFYKGISNESNIIANTIKTSTANQIKRILNDEVNLIAMDEMESTKRTLISPSSDPSVESPKDIINNDKNTKTKETLNVIHDSSDSDDSISISSLQQYNHDNSICSKNKNNSNKNNDLELLPDLEKNEISSEDEDSVGSKLSENQTPKYELSPLQKTINNLQLSAIPDHITCRDQEKKDIRQYISSSIANNGNASTLYISGMPGTGKTATVREVLKDLQADVYSKKQKRFNFVDINGMKLVDPNQVFSLIYKSLYHVCVLPNKAAQLLTDLYTNTDSIEQDTKHKNNDEIIPTVILVDELDYICNKSQNIIYQLFDWPTYPNSHLIVIGIANTMDLPERILNQRNRSRLSLTRYNFKPYDRQQIANIIHERLSISLSFSEEAVELCARKVAAISGDIRRALSLTRRALEIVLQENRSKLTIQDILKAANEHTDSYKLQLISCSSMYIKLCLIAIIQHFNRTGSDTITLSQLTLCMSVLFREYKKLKPLTFPQLLCIVNEMKTNELIDVDEKRYKHDTSFHLLFQSEDIGYALKNNEDLLALIDQ